MKYVIVDYPHGNELSLVAINNNETVALINTWRTGELHREIYNAIIDMSTRRKGEFVNTIYFLPFTEQIKKFRKNGDVVVFHRKAALIFKQSIGFFLNITWILRQRKTCFDISSLRSPSRQIKGSPY